MIAFCAVGGKIPVGREFGLDREGGGIVGRNGIVEPRLDREARRPCSPVQVGKQLGRGEVAFGDRFAFGIDNAFRSQMFDQQQSAVEIAGEDFRGGEALAAQGFGDRHEGRYVLGKMRDPAVGLAVADGRTVGHGGCIHQDAPVVSAANHLVAAGRCIADEIGAPGRAPARAVEKCADIQRPGDPRHGLGRTGDRRLAARLPFGELYLRSSRRQAGAGAFRPFDQRDAVGHRLVEAEFVELTRVREPVEVEMMHRDTGRIALDDREGRARNVEVGRIRHRAYEAAGERRLACPQVAAEGEDVAGPRRRREILSKPRRCGIIGKNELEPAISHMRALLRRGPDAFR